MNVRMQDLICREYAGKICTGFSFSVPIEDGGMGKRLKVDFSRLGIESAVWFVSCYFEGIDKYCKIQFELPSQNYPLEKVAERGLFYIQNWVKYNVQELQKVDFAIGDILGLME